MQSFEAGQFCPQWVGYRILPAQGVLYIVTMLSIRPFDELSSYPKHNHTIKLEVHKGTIFYQLIRKFWDFDFLKYFSVNFIFLEREMKLVSDFNCLILFEILISGINYEFCHIRAVKASTLRYVHCWYIEERNVSTMLENAFRAWLFYGPPTLFLNATNLNWDFIASYRLWIYLIHYQKVEDYSDILWYANNNP